MAEAKTVIAISAEIHQKLRRKAQELNTTIYTLANGYLETGLGEVAKSLKPEAPRETFSYRGNSFSGVDLDLEKMGLASEDNKEDEDDEE